MKRLFVCLVVLGVLAVPATASANHGWHINGGTIVGTADTGAQCLGWAGIFHHTGQQDLNSWSKGQCLGVSYVRIQCWNNLYNGFALRYWQTSVGNGYPTCESFMDASVAPLNGSPNWWNAAQTIFILTGNHTWQSYNHTSCTKNSNTTISCTLASPTITYN